MYDLLTSSNFIFIPNFMVTYRFLFFNLFFVSLLIFLLSLSIEYRATMAEIVGPVLYFRWPVEGPRCDRLVPSSTRSEFDLVVERRSRKSTPVVKDLSLLLPVSSERKSFPPRDLCRNPLLVTTGKYHPVQ